MNLKYKNPLVKELEKCNFEELEKLRENVFLSIPKGLEKKINISWFSDFLSHTYIGDWNEVPIPDTDLEKISMLGNHLEDIERELVDEINWIGLLRIINDMLIEDGRIIDLELSHIEWEKNRIIVTYST